MVLTSCTTSAVSNWKKGAPSAIANSPTLLLARSTPATIMPSLFPPGTPAPTRSLSRFISATVARSRDLRAALGRIKAKTFVMPMSSDMFFPPADCQAEWRLIPDAEFRPIQTIDGHLALFGADPNALSQLDKHLHELLATEI